MESNKPATKSEVLSIVETYEGMLRQEMRQDLLEEWSKWKAILCGMGGQ